MAIVETKDLTKIYTIGRNREVIGLNKVNFSVEEGEVFGILGPNGSGKTTCLKILIGILFATSGEALVMDKSPLDVRMKQKVGFLPENPYYYNYLTAPELLRFYGRIFGLPSEIITKRTKELLDLVDLTGCEKLSLKHYSKGMLERIGLAASMINDPKLLVLDEPTTGLDPIGCKATRDLLLELKSRGTTILLSSHYLSEVEKICDRIAIFHRGSLLATGKLDELSTKYKTASLEDLFVKIIEEFDLGLDEK